ncbi:hypothetical protein SETIT_3G151400v2 [Setaria italica]|uniref:Uncharacterized protein n=1 Tax=Setaria italica TaxID=4555 RepID=A0A368QF40_SETIT|nr:hypothetical protein SETIT_3G151400v2 [Setaria italica]
MRIRGRPISRSPLPSLPSSASTSTSFALPLAIHRLRARRRPDAAAAPPRSLPSSMLACWPSTSFLLSPAIHGLHACRRPDAIAISPGPPELYVGPSVTPPEAAARPSQGKGQGGGSGETAQGGCGPRHRDTRGCAQGRAAALARGRWNPRRRAARRAAAPRHTRLCSGEGAGSTTGAAALARGLWNPRRGAYRRRREHTRRGQQLVPVIRQRAAARSRLQHSATLLFWKSSFNLVT